MIRFQLLSLAPFIVLALIVLLVPLPFSTSSTTRQVMVTAEQFAFNPPVLRVNRGDRIRLTLHADVTHGFYLDGYGLQTPWLVFPGNLERHTSCGLCTECLKACPKDNWPGLGYIWHPRGAIDSVLI